MVFAAKDRSQTRAGEAYTRSAASNGLRARMLIVEIELQLQQLVPLPAVVVSLGGGGINSGSMALQAIPHAAM